ncbi:phosphoglycolate phosphatase [Corallincola spongiicola]|uniref:Phosphoglycolate phosphatase n=1 Tax=Corallincola spongiicola TaxID=2520508 RepID=A0ABY1WQA0_9GAMM|nr:phosphoglycolate phosphatase [Corallincola spongiicola]TAA46881.1 phosphoglycolate phosphatase [Corallincola spongiicola]
MPSSFRQIRAIAFDLDGTLLHSAPDLHYAVNQMLIELGREPVSLGQVTGWIGNGIEVLVQRALSRSFKVDTRLEPELVEQALGLFKLFYANALHRFSSLYPDVEAVLMALKAAGMKLAIVTNKATEFTLPLVQQFGLSGLIDLVVCGDTLPQKKPSPDQLLYCAEHFDISATELLMVGDSRNDIQAAKAALSPSIGLTYGYNYGEDIALCNPDRVLNQLAELPALLLSVPESV